MNLGIVVINCGAQSLWQPLHLLFYVSFLTFSDLALLIHMWMLLGFQYFLSE